MLQHVPLQSTWLEMHGQALHMSDGSQRRLARCTLPYYVCC